MNFTLKIQMHVNVCVKILSNVVQGKFLTQIHANVNG
jgi:hypothetical protein